MKVSKLLGSLTVGSVVALSSLGLSTVDVAQASAGTQPYPTGTLFIADQSTALWKQIPGDAQASYVAGDNEAVEDVAVDSSGDVFWTQAANGDVDELASGGSTTTLTVASQPYGIAVDSSGDVFYGATNGLFEIPSGQSAPKQICSLAVVTSLAVDGNSDIWAIARGELYLIPAGTSTTGAIDVPGYSDLTSVRLDAGNDLYASTGNSDGAIELPVGTIAATPFGSIDGFTQGIAVDSSGDVFIGQPAPNNESLGTVWEVNNHGTQSEFSNGQIESVGGLDLYPPIPPATRLATTTGLSTTSPSTVPSGQPVDLSATPSSGGEVQFEQDGLPLGAAVQTVDGVANLQTTLDNGNDQVTAEFLGDAEDAPSASNSLDFNVGTLSSATHISAPDGTKVPGDKDATLHVTVSGSGPIPTGTVTIYNGSSPLDKNVPLVSGSATASFALTPGTSKIDAVYSGDSTYSSSTSAKITFKTTTPYAPIINAVPKYTTTKTGTKVTIPVTVQGNKLGGAPTGTISANDGFTCGSSTSTATTLAAKCTETFTTSSESITVKISYSGGAHYVGETKAVAVQFGT